MTVFLLSHNLQVQSEAVPPWDGEELAAGLQRLSPSIRCAEALSHPHWRIRVESAADSAALAREVLEAWASLRRECGHGSDHAILALGGLKDTPASPGSPLELGAWGVDVVETEDVNGFLAAIDWPSLKAGRPAEGVFELVLEPS